MGRQQQHALDEMQRVLLSTVVLSSATAYQLVGSEKKIISCGSFTGQTLEAE